MTKHIYKGGVWSDVEEGRAEVNENLEVPSAVYDDEIIREIDTNKLPFKRVLNGHLIVTIDRYKKPKDAKIVRPPSSQHNSTKGTVVALADDIKDIQIGDKVLYSQFAGYLLVFEGFPFLRTLSKEEILAILKNDAPDIIMAGG